MARADISQTTDAIMDAVGLLTRDHRLIAELFKEFGVAGKQQLDPLARRLCKMLRIHGQVKEEVFYPAVRRALNDNSLFDTAQRAYIQTGQSIMQLESLTSDDDTFDAAVQKLADEATAHFAWEEQEVLPKLRQAKLDLVSIGINLAERRDTLMDVLGLHADDEEAAVFPDESPAVALAAAARQQRARASEQGNSE